MIHTMLVISFYTLIIAFSALGLAIAAGQLIAWWRTRGLREYLKEVSGDE
jgi:hypothetical protein